MKPSPVDLDPKELLEPDADAPLARDSGAEDRVENRSSLRS